MILTMLGAASSIVAQSVEATPTVMPASFNGNPSLYIFNLFVMTAMTFLGAMMAGKQARWIYDHSKDPVSIYRAILLLAPTGICLRCGAEAMALWGCNPDDPTTTARVVMVLPLQLRLRQLPVRVPLGCSLPGSHTRPSLDRLS